MNPRYPVFIPTKGRAESRLTIRLFERLGVPYRAVVEPQDRDAYLEAGVPADRLVVLPADDRGLIATRNFIWDLARDEGHPYFWSFDDNVRGLFRLNRNLKVPVADGTVLRVIESFAERYDNLPLCGMNYYMWVRRKEPVPPILLNRVIYANTLFQTDYRDPRGHPYRFERMFEDHDLCLRVLEDGACTALFNAFLIDKWSGSVPVGGLAYRRSEDPEQDDRWRMGEELRRRHPSRVRVLWESGRARTIVDYSAFRSNRLHRRAGVAVPDGPDEYGMVLEAVS